MRIMITICAFATATTVAYAATLGLFDATSGHYEIRRDASPLNYSGTRAALVLQNRDTAAGSANELIPGAVFQFRSLGNGVVNSATELSQTIWQGALSFQEKSGDGSAHSFTSIGELGEYGSGQYNELSGYTAELTNKGSLHGTVSGAELLLKDSADGGFTSFNTRMDAVVGRVQRYNNGDRRSSNFLASSEGPEDVDSVLAISTGGTRKWKNGIDLTGANLSTGRAGIFPNNSNLSWQKSDGSAAPAMFVSAADEIWLSAMSDTASIRFSNSALSTAFRVSPIANPVNNLAVSPSTADSAPIINAEGTDSDINIRLQPKGNGLVEINPAKLVMTANSGSAGAPPSQVSGYLKIELNGTIYRIPLYAN